MTGPYTTNVADPTLDLDEAIGQRSATFQFLLVDGVTGLNKGEIHPLRDSPPTLSHDSGRTIPRTLRLTFGVADTLAINPLTDRVLPFMLIGGGTYPLGRFMVSDGSTLLSTGGDLGTMQLVDEMFIIDQEISEGFAPPAASTTAAILALLGSVITSEPILIDIEASPFLAAGAWSIGTTRGQILEALATQGDYLRPWMDSAGVFRMRRTFDPAAAVPSFDFDGGFRVYRDSIINTNDLLASPNRFVVTSNSGGDVPITASADIPTTAPHSIARRGFVIPKSTNIQLDSQAQAQAIANGLATTASVFERCTLSTAPDPRHDAYDVILWQGQQWLETAWSMELTEGGEMTHTLQRAYL